MEIRNIPYSILDLAIIRQDHTIADAFHDSLEAAQHAEKFGYKRYWLAEHHNSDGVGSAATSVLIGYIAQSTRTIRVGSGGVMLPNHSPYIIAEQFGTLETLYPGRIDLGLGRAPGTDQLTARAIGRQQARIEEFPDDIRKLQQYFSKHNLSNAVRAIPGEGLDIPIWVLGSSPDSALLAGALGLPYAFASHFAPAHLFRAIDLYRSTFKPSAVLDKPYMMAAANILMADTDEEANYHFSSVLQMFMGVITGKRQPMQPPVDDINEIWDEMTRQAVLGMLACSFVGSPARVKQHVDAFIAQTGIDEIMITVNAYDQQVRRDSLRMFAEIMGGEESCI